MVPAHRNLPSVTKRYQNYQGSGILEGFAIGHGIVVRGGALPLKVLGPAAKRRMRTVSGAKTAPWPPSPTHPDPDLIRLPVFDRYY